MFFLATSYLFLGLVTLYVKGIPAPETFYDVLVKRCPILNVSDAPFKNQAIFQKCNWTWQEFGEIKALTEESKQKVLCLLYYDSFTSFCTEMSTKKITNITISLVPDLKDYNIDKVCNSLAIFPSGKTFPHNLSKMITDEHICNRLCLNFDGSLVNECCLAHYFANYNVSSLIPVVPNVPQLESNPAKVISAARISNTSENSMISQKKDAEQSNNNSPKVNQTGNINTTVQHDSGKSEQELKKNSKLTAEHTLENKNAVGDQSPTNTNKNESQTKDKSAVAEKPPTKDAAEIVKEPQTKDETNAKDQTPSKGAPQTEEQSEKQSLSPNNNSDQNSQENEGDDQPPGESDVAFNNSESPGDKVGDDEDDDNPNDNGKAANVKPVGENAEEKKKPPSTLGGEMPANYNTSENLDGESYFFSYFMVICVLFVLGYVGYHNRQKVMALMLEGKRGKRQARGRRPNSANYHKLDSNLEEAISSTCTKNSSHVIY